MEDQAGQRGRGLTPVEIVTALAVFLVIVTGGVLLTGGLIHF
jgi:hypothetical protein